MTDREIDDLWLEAFKASADDGRVRQRFAELCYQKGVAQVKPASCVKDSLTDQAEADRLRSEIERLQTICYDQLGELTAMRAADHMRQRGPLDWRVRQHPTTVGD